MDGRGFDNLARRLARATTRRTMLRAGAAAIVAGGTLAGIQGVDAHQRRTCRPLTAGCLQNAQCCSGLCERRPGAPRRQRHRCVCPEGTVACGEACVDLQTDEQHCGQCGHDCGDRGVCVSGSCEILPPVSCSDFVPTEGAEWCSAIVGDFEVIGCDSEYFSGLSTATVDTVPCTTNAECVALGAEYGLDCSDPDTIECYCELGYYEGLDWTENVPWECSVTSKYSGVQCPAIPGAE